MKPILFNTPMTRAILDGRKTQTRRVVKTGSYTPLEIGRSKFYTFRDELNGKPGAWAGFYCDRDVFVGRDGKQHIDAVYAKIPYQPGDVLYVRETWGIKTTLYSESIVYRADYSCREEWPEDVRWHPSIHMPKAVARIFLRVTDVRVERLEDISPRDVKMEGIVSKKRGDEFDYEAPPEVMDRFAFEEVWDSTIKPADLDRYGWNANPWVWVFEFERIRKEDAE